MGHRKTYQTFVIFHNRVFMLSYDPRFVEGNIPLIIAAEGGIIYA